MLFKSGINSKQTLYNIRILGRKFAGKQARRILQLIEITKLPDVRSSSLPVNSSHTTFRSICKIIDICSKRRIPDQSLNEDFIRAQCISECFHDIRFFINQIMTKIISDTNPGKTFVKIIPIVFPFKFSQLLNTQKNITGKSRYTMYKRRTFFKILGK